MLFICCNILWDFVTFVRNCFSFKTFYIFNCDVYFIYKLLALKLIQLILFIELVYYRFYHLDIFTMINDDRFIKFPSLS